MLTGINTNSEYSNLVSKRACFITEPSVKFQFLRTAFSEYQTGFSLLNHIPCIKWFIYNFYIAKALHKADKSKAHIKPNHLPLILKSLSLYYKPRLVILLMILFFSGSGFIYLNYSSFYNIELDQWHMAPEKIADKISLPLSSDKKNENKRIEPEINMEDDITIEDAGYLLSANIQNLNTIEQRPKIKNQINNIEEFSGANTLKPDAIWQVEAKEDYELYSNGLRIFREFETSTGKRYFLIFKKQSMVFPDAQKAYSSPIGILYHTTESDILPFIKDYNNNLLTTTHSLLKHIKKIACYNYLIDRFGRVYRIVKEMDYANHAGQSIWSNQDDLYVNLNHSFIGVSFDGRSTLAGTMNEPSITPMQLISAKRLSDMLRQRYKIDDQNCVVHGLVSVNGSNKIIGYHLDWAQDFPFELLGLTNKYLVSAPSILEFGFSYSDYMIKILGGHAWPGVYLAENTLIEKAKQEKVSRMQLSLELQSKYDAMVNYQNKQREKLNQLNFSKKDIQGSKLLVIQPH